MSHVQAAVSNPADLFAAMQTLQGTTQAQIERFNQHMVRVKGLANRVSGEAQLKQLGEVSLVLHEVHGLLFGGALAGEPQPPQAVAVSAETGGDLSTAMAEVSALLGATQHAVTRVDALLASAEAHFEQLHAAA